MGLAGFLTKINITGTPTAMSSQAMSTHSTVANTYRINSTARRVWDRDAAFTFFKNSGTTAVAAIGSSLISNINYLFGKVTFTTAFNSTADEPVSVSGNYLPLQAIPGGHAYNLNINRENQDDTDYQTSGWRSRVPTFVDVSLSVSRFDNVDLEIRDFLVSGGSFVVEVRPGGVSDVVGRGFFIVESETRSGDVGGLESGDVQFQIDSTTEANFSFDTIA